MRFIWENRELIKNLIERDIHNRYKSTFLGMFWVIATPLLMLSVYATVFTTLLKSRWPGSTSGGDFEYTIFLFCGLIVFNWFADIINRSSGLVLSNVNYVKKVIFPLEILPIVAIGSGMFQTIISVFILLLFYFIEFETLNLTTLYLPVIILPFMFLMAGMSLFLAALGVFVRDIGQAIGIMITGLMFLSPIFYPLSVLPEALQPYLYLNPVTFIIEQMREIIVLGHTPNWSGLLIYSICSLLIAWLGYFFFIKTRRGFADVL
jgi:lipopolysaccharide transport system permease protein